MAIEKVCLFDGQQTFRTSFYLTSSQRGLNKYWFTGIFKQWWLSEEYTFNVMGTCQNHEKKISRLFKFSYFIVKCLSAVVFILCYPNLVPKSGIQELIIYQHNSQLKASTLARHTTIYALRRELLMKNLFIHEFVQQKLLFENFWKKPMGFSFFGLIFSKLGVEEEWIFETYPHQNKKVD